MSARGGMINRKDIQGRLFRCSLIDGTQSTDCLSMILHVSQRRSGVYPPDNPGRFVPHIQGEKLEVNDLSGMFMHRNEVHTLQLGAIRLAPLHFPAERFSPTDLKMDYLLTDSKILPKYVIETPYLSSSLVQDDSAAMSQISSLNVSRPSTVTKCTTSFPLGLALVELALWKPISEIASQDDETDPYPALANLKKATRLLPVISEELGPWYKDVVEECL